MAHSRINIDAMFEWIERCSLSGTPMPDDAAICDRFGFASPESARTLLAELADKGRITIKGFGASRAIALGRKATAAAPAPRPIPTVVARPRDDDVDQLADRLVSIATRGRANASALLATVAPQPEPSRAAPAPSIAEEPADMSDAKSKSITFVATGAVLDAIKSRTADGTPNSRAVADILEAAVALPAKVVSAPAAPAEFNLGMVTVAELLSELTLRFAQASADDDQLRDAIERAEAAEADAKRLSAERDAAVTKLENIRAAIG